MAGFHRIAVLLAVPLFTLLLWPAPANAARRVRGGGVSRPRVAVRASAFRARSFRPLTFRRAALMRRVPSRVLFPTARGVRVAPFVRRTVPLSARNAAFSNRFRFFPATRFNRSFFVHRAFHRNFFNPFLFGGLFGSVPLLGVGLPVAAPVLGAVAGPVGLGDAYPMAASGYAVETPAVPGQAPAEVPAPEQQAPGGIDLGTVLTALGVPNEDGQISWPLGLRILPPADQTRALRDQIQALLQVTAVQAMSGEANPRFLAELTRAADRLHVLLLQRRVFMAPATFQEADRFLAQLENARKLLR